MGEEQDSQCGSDGSGGQIGAKSGQHCSAVAVAAGDPAPDGPESVFCFSGVSFVDVGDSLAEVVLCG